MKALMCCVLCGVVMAANGAELRVAVLDFEDVTATEPSQALGLALNGEAFAQKGALLLNQQLVMKEGFSVVDRRDFISKVAQVSPQDAGLEVERPTFIQAAQHLRVDAVVRGSLLSLSSGKRILNPTEQGGGIAFEKITVRVMVQALDAVDGTVLAAAQGKASEEFRQSGTEQTKLGEDEVLAMLEKALTGAVEEVGARLAKRVAARATRKRVSVTVKSTEDPALVEIDGVLVGSTPMTGFQVYEGDHTLTVSRPNYTTLSKRLALSSDVEISVPMFRLNLTAKERKEIYSSIDMKAYLTNGKPDVLIQTLE